MTTALPATASILKERRAWYWYDWANSAFTTTVVTLFFGPFITSVAKAAADAQGNVQILGLNVEYGAYWGWLVSLSVITQVLVLPVLGQIADSSPRKKWLLAGLCYTGAVATVGMYFIHPGDFVFGGQMFLIANLAFGGSNVVYNSFLSDLAPEDERDSVSSKGFALGYLGGGLLLALNLALYTFADRLGISGGVAVRLSLASAGVWWGGFALITFFGLKNRPPLKPRVAGKSILLQGFVELAHTIRSMFGYKQTLLFVVAYLFFNDAVQTVITLAGQFGSEELHIEQGTLTAVILMVQLLAFPGAMLFSWVARRITTKWAIVTTLVLWILVVLAMYGVVYDTRGFVIAGAVVALVLGGTQALTRSLYSQLIPTGHEAAYFSLYEIGDKGTSWIGPAVFAIVRTETHSYRAGILTLPMLFIIGMALLVFVNVPKATQEARGRAS